MKTLSLLIGLSILSSASFGSITFEEYKSCEKGPLKVRPGNVNRSIPSIPKSSLKNLESWRYSQREMMDIRYESVKVKLIANNYVPMIKKAARSFDMDPVNVLGAIIGEHVFNMDMKDSAQDYLLRLPGWMRRWSGFSDEFEIPLRDILKQKSFDICHENSNEYDKWECYGAIWNRKFRDQKCDECRDSDRYPNKSLKFVFFSPFGSTYGIGQLGPMKALMVTDLVSERVSHMPYLSLDDIEEVYSSVLDPEKSFYYVAATVYKAIELYKQHACFDISTNPGVAATLYNLGAERSRAKAKKRASLESLEKGNGLVVPEENYYGWYVNEKLNDMEKFLERH